MEPADDNDDEMTVSMDPLKVRHEHVPFVFDEYEPKLAQPIDLSSIRQEHSLEVDQYDKTEPTMEIDETSEMKMDTPNTQTNGIDHNHRRPSPITTTAQMKLSKMHILQKESADPFTCHVGILQMPKSVRTLSPAASDASPNGTIVTRNVKNTALAKRFAQFGDLEFKRKKWDSARQWYNHSLCHAEQKSYLFSTSYAKRAQCFFNERMYSTCWTDLILSHNSGLPAVLMPQLERHKQSCKKLITMNQQNQWNQSMEVVQPQLSAASNPKFPEIVDALRIDWDEYGGRRISARQPISVGQILIIETGFVATTTAYYEKCCICLTTDTNLVPCTKCTQAMLCKNCVNGWFHQIECQLKIALDISDYEHPWVMKVLRSFLIAINLFESVDEMMAFVGGTTSSGCGVQSPRIALTVPPIIDRKSKYRAFLQLITVPAMQPLEILEILSQLKAAMLDHPAIASKFTTIKSQRFLAHLLIHHTCVVSAFATKIGSALCDSSYTEIVAPITSYLKHSCAPNVSKFLVGTSIIVVAMRPIEPGEQLNASYCDVLKVTHQRQHMLQRDFGFQCSCKRCLLTIVDRPIQVAQCDEAEQYVQQNFEFLASNDQIKRKHLTDRVVGILQRFGRMPWNYTIGWAYVVFSLLLSHRFQKKLRY